MAATSGAALSRDIQALFEDGTAVGLSDRQLLDRFAGRRDPTGDAAFEALVRRHGPMVWRVCRNALHDPDDAQDAFQATFLVLVRRIGALRGLDSLGGWLYGVACRVSARARVEAARRRAIEGRAALRVVEAVEPDVADVDDFGPVVQEEVRRLPEKYRAVVALCYWEGLTHEQAAARLGCPLGTVRSRIARARDLLQRRLTRRGLDLGSVVPVAAAVPDSWVVATVKAMSCGGGSATAGFVSASVATLVQDVLGRMLMTKLKMTAVCLSFIGIGAVGALLAAPQAGPARPASAAAPGWHDDRNQRPAAPSGSRQRTPTPADYVIEPPDMLRVEVLDALAGRPISGERLVRPDGKISLGFYGDVYVAGATLPEAKARVVVHLRKYFSDEDLGLLEHDRATGDFKRDRASQLVRKDPRETDRVLVEIVAHNSKNYYVLGDVRHPGRFPLTDNETVLDALQAAGVLSPIQGIRLVRPAPPGACCEQVLPVDLAAIANRDDPTTNYQLMPGDRVIVLAIRGASAVGGEPAHDGGSPRRQVDDRPAIRDIERRLGDVERKLDRVLQALEQRGP